METNWAWKPVSRVLMREGWVLSRSDMSLWWLDNEFPRPLGCLQCMWSCDPQHCLEAACPPSSLACKGIRWPGKMQAETKHLCRLGCWGWLWRVLRLFPLERAKMYMVIKPVWDESTESASGSMLEPLPPLPRAQMVFDVFSVSGSVRTCPFQRHWMRAKCNGVITNMYWLCVLATSRILEMPWKSLTQSKDPVSVNCCYYSDCCDYYRLLWSCLHNKVMCFPKGKPQTHMDTHALHPQQKVPKHLPHIDVNATLLEMRSNVHCFIKVFSMDQN